MSEKGDRRRKRQKQQFGQKAGSRGLGWEPQRRSERGQGGLLCLAQREVAGEGIEKVALRVQSPKLEADGG